MPKYQKAHVTCYCGRTYIVTPSIPLKCLCGITLHVQQKKGGTGKVWGTISEGKKEQYQSIMKMIQRGESQLDCEWLL